MKTLAAFLLALTIANPANCYSQDNTYWGLRKPGHDQQGQGREENAQLNNSGAQSCRATGGNDYADPAIEVTDQSADAVAQRTLRIKGYVEGVCLSEAGVYVNGQKRNSISVTSVPAFKRFSFQTVVSPGQKREIRAYNVQGRKAVYSLEDTDTSSDPLGIGINRPSDSDEDEDSDSE